jgi:hypothetical protein
MVTVLHMVALGDRCFFATRGRQILPQKAVLCGFGRLIFAIGPIVIYNDDFSHNGKKWI